METCIELRDAGPGAWRLRLEGRLPPGWCGNLATGLSRAGVAIRGGHAVAGRGTGWRARLDLRSEVGGADPRQLDFAGLLEKDTGAGFRTPIRLVDSRVTPSRAHGGSLLLRVEGEDRVGFLAALLRRLAYLSLFPMELELETRGGRALDRFWLGGVGGTPPRESAARALEASLGALVRKRVPASERPLGRGSDAGDGRGGT